MINRIAIALVLMASTAISMEPVHEGLDDNLETYTNPEALRDVSELFRAAMRRADILRKQLPTEDLINKFIEVNSTASSFSSEKKEAKKLKRQAAQEKKEETYKLIDQFVAKNTYAPENRASTKPCPMAKL